MKIIKDEKRILMVLGERGIMLNSTGITLVLEDGSLALEEGSIFAPDILSLTFLRYTFVVNEIERTWVEAAKSSLCP